MLRHPLYPFSWIQMDVQQNYHISKKTSEYNQEAMFITHPQLVTAYTLGVFGLITVHSLVDEYKLTNARVHEIHVDRHMLETKNSHDRHVLETQNSHEKYMLETKNSHEKYMLETKNSHDKYMLENSRWWKRIV